MFSFSPRDITNQVMKLGLKLIECVKNHSSGLFGPQYPKSENSTTFLSQTQFGWITALILFAVLLEKEKTLNRIKSLMDPQKICDGILTALCFLLFLVSSPLVVVVIVGFWMLKKIEEFKLRKIQNPIFKDFLNGEDAVWACEDEFSKSFINVLAFIRASDENTPQNVLQSLREKVSTAVLSKNLFPKMFFRRIQSDFGYFYWTDENILMIDDYVRLASCDNSEAVLKEDTFRKQMSRISNMPLPADNSALWECLVGQQLVQCRDDIKLPVSCLSTWSKKRNSISQLADCLSGSSLAWWWSSFVTLASRVCRRGSKKSRADTSITRRHLGRKDEEIFHSCFGVFKDATFHDYDSSQETRQ